MRRTFSWLVGVGVIVLFVKSSAAHLANPYAFLSTVYSYKMVDPISGLSLAAFLPFLQLTIVVCLLLRIFPSAAFASAGILFLMFATAQASILHRGLNISCGCYGVVENNPITGWTLATSLGCAIACLVASFCSRMAFVSDAVSTDLPGAGV